MLDQAIEDMRKGKKEAREAIIEAKTQKRLLERKWEKAKAEILSNERKAVKALEGGDETLARRFLELKLAAEQRAAAEGSAVEEQDNQINQLVAAERELDARLSQLPARRAALMARQSAAKAKGAKVGAAHKAKNSVSAALDAFDRMEERIIRAEVEAEVISESSPALPEDTMLGSLDADRALEDLKSKVAGQLPSHAGAAHPTETVEAEVIEADPVEDSLADLKAKLNQA